MEYALGVLVSAVVELLKKQLGLSKAMIYLSLLILAIVAATTYYFLKATSVWGTVVTIIITAGSFHSFILKNIKEGKKLE